MAVDMTEAYEPPYITRRAPQMEKYVTIAPVVMEGYPDAHHVFLQITNQRFCVSHHACETLEEAEWMRDMLCVALEKIVSDAAQSALPNGESK